MSEWRWDAAFMCMVWNIHRHNRINVYGLCKVRHIMDPNVDRFVCNAIYTLSVGCIKYIRWNWMQQNQYEHTTELRNREKEKWSARDRIRARIYFSDAVNCQFEFQCCLKQSTMLPLVLMQSECWMHVIEAVKPNRHSIVNLFFWSIIHERKRFVNLYLRPCSVLLSGLSAFRNKIPCTNTFL